ncbi:OLC1v1037660C1 [Oldenlandia corymbosa var. corymbosa]|uniref:OLC1v1037660C1 n=1 Tax=Oldenlandia corymbosa var. corymbosa TaxID=529605 RepID=A0AAV1CZE8_OLDCO|nr:OLC1v1037660C1 [Oldenlandia corymbosa var. corymbosa]
MEIYSSPLVDGLIILPGSIIPCNVKVSTGRGTKMKNPRFRPPNDPNKKLSRIRYSSNLTALLEDAGIETVNKGVNTAGTDVGGIVNFSTERLLKWYSVRFRDCAEKTCLNEGKAIHGKLIKTGINPDTHLFVSLINFYAKCGALNFARKAFDEMPERDVVSWTALISGFVAEGLGSESVELFCEMRREGIRHNEFTLATILKGCSIASDFEFAKQLHADVVKGGDFEDVYVGSALIDLYTKCGELEYAENVLSVMPEQNSVSWNALLNGYAQMGDGDKVLSLFCEMMKSEVRFTNYTISTVLKGCASSQILRAGQVVHSMAIKLGGEVDDFVCCGLVDMYSKCQMVNDALHIFWRIKNPDPATWCTMINGLDQQGQKVEALDLFQLMMRSGLRPNQFLLSAILDTAADLGNLEFCRSIHACICKYCFDSDTLVSNALISMYMKLGLVFEGSQVFSDMSQRDVVSWNALLSGFHGNESSDEAQMIFKSILVKNIKPNKFTFISILRNCASQSNASFGKQVHAHVLKNGIDI